MRGGFLLGRGDPIGAGYAGVEVVGGVQLGKAQEGAGCGQKPELQGLIFGEKNAG